jgi:predicted nuclease of predicted toxin-antitoxin system
VRLRDLRYLADENVHPDVCAWLRSERIDVVTVAESGGAGLSDVEVLRRATAEGRAVITHDADFGMMCVANREDFVAILYLRPGHISPPFTIESIRTAWSIDPEVSRGTIIVAMRSDKGVTVRVRRTHLAE